LQHFAKDDISLATLAHFEKHPFPAPEEAKKTSVACAALAAWGQAVVAYGKTLHDANKEASTKGGTWADVHKELSTDVAGLTTKLTALMPDPSAAVKDSTIIGLARFSLNIEKHVFQRPAPHVLTLLQWLRGISAEPLSMSVQATPLDSSKKRPDAKKSPVATPKKTPSGEKKADAKKTDTKKTEPKRTARVSKKSPTVSKKAVGAEKKSPTTGKKTAGKQQAGSTKNDSKKDLVKSEKKDDVPSSAASAAPTAPSAVPPTDTPAPAATSSAS